MALAASSAFASFDINANTNILDISDVLSEALILDFNFLGVGMDFSMDDPVEDTTFYWNEEALNGDTVTLNGSVSSSATTFTIDSSSLPEIGMLMYVQGAEGQTEVIQITDVGSATSLTVTRGYNSTTQASIADNATLALMPVSQEASDFDSDKSVKPTAESNFTQIAFAGDLFIARSQLKRKMATIALDVDRQLANRAIELKRAWTRINLYGEKSSSSGSDSVYRSTGGLRYWIRDQGGIVDSTDEAISLADLNANNKTAVDAGVYNDTLLIGTDLVGGVAAIEASNRRLVESERKVGYAVNRVLLNQGNEVDVIIDGRVNTGDYFLYSKRNVRWRPLLESGMFVIAATDFTDGVKRRIGSEGGLEVRQPQGMVYAHTKSAS